MDYANKIFDVLFKKVQEIESSSLRNLVLDRTIQFAGGDAKELLIKSLDTGKFSLKSGEHVFTKSQRYQIIKKIYSS